ncbi:hypothetical protein ACXWTF_13195 [Thiomicrolovo sp. ZZH C-3]
MIRSILSVAFVMLLLPSMSAADSIDERLYPLIYSIAAVERHTERPIGYPFLISFNAKKSKTEAVRRKYEELFVDNRTMDCRNKELCVQVATEVIAAGDEYVDLGALQICYHYHTLPMEDYFELSKSFEFAMEFTKRNIKLHGWTWGAVAHYNSSDPQRNEIYATHLEEAYNRYAASGGR